MGRNKIEYTCKKCNYTTNKKSSYINHINRKTPCEEISICEFCNKQFISRKLLIKHLDICKIKTQVDKYKLKINNCQ